MKVWIVVCASACWGVFIRVINIRLVSLDVLIVGLPKWLPLHPVRTDEKSLLYNSKRSTVTGSSGYPLDADKRVHQYLSYRCCPQGDRGMALGSVSHRQGHKDQGSFDLAIEERLWLVDIDWST
jgi:hypothetical protein